MSHPDYLFAIALDRQRDILARAEASRRVRRRKKR
jgi:hypothetical protein